MKVGDVVYLKSGSFPMIVVSIDGNAVGTNWMNGGTPMSNVYPTDCLTTVNPAPALNDATAKEAAKYAPPPPGP